MNARHIENAVEFNSSPAGFWSSALQPGKLSVNVSRADGSTWHSEVLELTDDVTLHVDLASMRVRGTVTVGDKPLEAKLTFRDKLGRTATATTDGDGKFSVLLPRSAEQKWDVVVNSEKPPVRKTLRSVPIRIAESGDGTADIKVPAMSITGEFPAAAIPPRPRHF